ncbi:MAG: DUF6221 family protein [Actinomycetota bacterium]|nr:DUF6221 family protein [Actinomycetota bacterium]
MTAPVNATASIVDFIRARAAEDRAIAEATGSIAWGPAEPDNPSYAISAHIYRHGPERAIRFAAVIDEILDGYAAVAELAASGRVASDRDRLRALDQTLRCLAVTWADHEDFQPAWLPAGLACLCDHYIGMRSDPVLTIRQPACPTHGREAAAQGILAPGEPTPPGYTDDDIEAMGYRNPFSNDGDGQ